VKIYNFKNFVIFLSTFLIFTIPILIYGVPDLEEHEWSGFTLKILSDNYFNPFIFYYDLAGPGTRLPLGSGLFNFPTIFFIENKKVYYFSTILICFFIQTLYLKKLLKYFNIHKNFYLLNFFYLFSISFFCYVYINEWALNPFLQVSFFPVIFYYSIKYLKKEKSIDLFKLAFFIAYIHINIHVVSSFSNCIYIILFFLLNKKFFFLKKFYFYIAFLFFLFLIGENLYNFIIEILKYENIEREIQGQFHLKHFFSGIYLFLSFFEQIVNLDLPIVEPYESIDARLPFSGIIFYIAIYKSIEILALKKSEEVFQINILFLIFTILSFLSFSEKLYYVSGIWTFRDFYNFLSVILFGLFLKDIKIEKLKKMLIFISFLFSVVFYFQNVNFIGSKENFNTVKTNVRFKDEKMHKFFSNIKNEKFNKIYLTEEVFSDFRLSNSDLTLKNNKSNIFSISDLEKYGLYPFTFYFKFSAKNSLRKPMIKMHSPIEPNFDEINNEFFLDLFNIKHILAYEYELKNINMNYFEILKKERVGNTNLVLLLKNRSNFLTINKDSLQKLRLKKCEKYEKVKCLIDNKVEFDFNDRIRFTRIGLNKYKIQNLSNEEVNFLLPFTFEMNWKYSEREIFDIQKTLMFIKLNSNEEGVIYNFDYYRTVLKLISFTLFLLSIIFFFLQKLKYYR
tara:strand:- start:650 stop:2680 length:2031 start_codon:yes stop_codon:yes gene_type:complete